MPIRGFFSQKIQPLGAFLKLQLHFQVFVTSLMPPIPIFLPWKAPYVSFFSPPVFTLVLPSEMCFVLLFHW